MSLTSGVTALSAAGKSACAVTGGGVECWGYNADGELGNSSTTSSPIPVQVATLASGVTSVSVGFYPAGTDGRGATTPLGSSLTELRHCRIVTDAERVSDMRFRP